MVTEGTAEKSYVAKKHFLFLLDCSIKTLFIAFLVFQSLKKEVIPSLTSHTAVPQLVLIS